MPSSQAALKATEEVSGPLTAGTLTTLLVFGPIVFVQGLAAALFRDLSLSVVTSVGASLMLALTLMPVMMTGRRGRNRAEEGGPVGPSVRRSVRLGVFTRSAIVSPSCYERGMKWCLAAPGHRVRHRVVVTAFTVFIAIRLPREILPRSMRASWLRR